MSYCRWSSDNMRSDVYAYEDCTGGYTIHVRSVHPVNPEILPEFPIQALKSGDVEAIKRWQEEDREAHYELVYEDNNLPYDDDTLHASDIYDLKEKLDWLKTVGYYVPRSAFEMIDGEIDND